MEIAEKKTLKQLAVEEIKQERMDEAKDMLKEKYRLLADAKLIVANINRDIEDLEIELEQDLDAIG